MIGPVRHVSRDTSDRGRLPRSRRAHRASTPSLEGVVACSPAQPHAHGRHGWRTLAIPSSPSRQIHFAHVTAYFFS